MTEVDRKWELNTFFKMYCGIVLLQATTAQIMGMVLFRGTARIKREDARFKLI